MNETNDILQEEVQAPTEEAVAPAVAEEVVSPSPKKERRYSKKRILIYSILAGLAFVAGVALITLSVWYVNTFNLEFKHLLYNLASPVEGTGSATVDQILAACLPWILLGVAVFVTAAILVARKTAVCRILRRVGAIFCAVLMLASVVVTLFAFRIPQYIASLDQQTTLYEEYYVDPAIVSITDS